MRFEFSSNLELQWSNRCSWRAFSSNSSSASSRQGDVMLRSLQFRSYSSQSEITMDEGISNSHNSKHFLLQSPKTVQGNDYRRWMQKKSSSLVENWSRILEMKVCVLGWKWRECERSRSVLGNCDIQLWLGDDLDYIWMLNCSSNHIISKMTWLMEIVIL